MPPAHLRGPAVPPTPYVRGCTGKVGYVSQAEARVMVREIKRVHGATRHEYLCRHCAHWHLTSTREN